MPDRSRCIAVPVVGFEDAVEDIFYAARMRMRWKL
jgi:hypothetical protein